MKKLKVLIFIIVFLLITDISAKENILTKKELISDNITATGCAPTTAIIDLDINNVRTSIMVGGDMWWDLNSAKYEVPKGSGKHSFFAGALWAGGLDAGNQLKLAAMTYRQVGNDFWGGPINQNIVDISPQTCNDYDQHWKITQQEVLDFINTGVASAAIINWPGNGNQANFESQFLAPFHDNNSDGIYNYLDGDYPLYDFTNSMCENVLLGDQTIWWIFNDVGNIHLETQAPAIGLEVHAMAYAYSSANEALNNSTFYQFKMINRSSTTLYDSYWGFFVDPDLGNMIDDYVGCDINLNLAYCYNSDLDDDGVNGYGIDPPAVGIKILDGITGDNGNLLGMTNFIAYNNDWTVTGNPFIASDFYNYLKSTWKDTTPVTFGGIGYGGSIPVNYMYPDSSDIFNPTNWTEVSVNNLAGDRRFITSSGSFTFQPGQVKIVNSAAVWARADSGGPIASLHKLKTAAATVQNYFDNCFFAVGINEPDLLNGIKLFPNPSINGKFAISNIPVGSEISIYTMDGKLIDKRELFSNSYESKMKVGKGVYLIRVKNKSAEKVLKWINLY
jgi:hypothetical protein